MSTKSSASSCCVPCQQLRNACVRLLRRNTVEPCDGSTTGVEQKEEEIQAVKDNDNQVHCQNETEMCSQELEEQFHIVDLNKDGCIDADELKQVMKNLGIPYSDEEISTIIKHADVNGSGKIEQDDFVKVMSDYLNSDDEESFDVKNLFDFFDSDKDGFITHQELQFAIGEVLQDSISEKEIGTMMRLACKQVKKTKEAMISFYDFQLLLEEVGFSV